MDELLKEIKNGIVPLLESENLYNVVVQSKSNDEIKSLIEKEANEIIISCCFSFNLFDYLTLTHLVQENISKEKALQELHKALNNKYSKKTLIYLVSKYKKLDKSVHLESEELFKIICEELKTMDTTSAAAILFDLYNFYDFRGYLFQHYPVLTHIIRYYKQYDQNVVGNGIYNGSSIIAKLLDPKCQAIAHKYITNLIETENVCYGDVTMIGGGGSNLVFKIGDKVLKLGETRNNRKIFVNHRILASIVRKLEKDENGNELFYAEVMRYIYTDVTPEERDELKKSLANQGIIWEDDKLENCGRLPDDYDNICPIVNDHEEVAANIDNPFYRENFMRRRRKIVVLDNDNMHLDTTRLQKY